MSGLLLAPDGRPVEWCPFEDCRSGFEPEQRPDGDYCVDCKRRWPDDHPRATSIDADD